jgi:phage shock protein PspC (stress-responsive transcriptional regulator)
MSLRDPGGDRTTLAGCAVMGYRYSSPNKENRVGETLSRPLRRSRHDRVMAGVCGGIAKWLGWDPTAVRVIYVLASLISAAFPGIIGYIILWLVMPEEA